MEAWALEGISLNGFSLPKRSTNTRCFPIHSSGPGSRQNGISVGIGVADAKQNNSKKIIARIRERINYSDVIDVHKIKD